MKIVALANCQGESIVACAKAMCPDAEFDFVSGTELRSGAQTLDTICNKYDIIFAQNTFRRDVPADAWDKVFYFPSISFPAFHPDMTYLRGQQKGKAAAETVTNEMVMYHSAIILTGYVSGLSSDEIVDLFRTEIFAKLGYFDVWTSSRKELLAAGAAAGMPLGALFEQWLRRGCFMYSMNHPRLHVMADVTRALLTQSGLPIVSQNVASYLDDPLRLMSIWPVYPGIAERLGLFGDYMFMKGLLEGGMSLKEFIERSSERYARYETASLEPLNFSLADYRGRLGLNAPKGQTATKVSDRGNPYEFALANQFWKNSVAGVPMAELAPVMSPRFKVEPSDRIATAGSCFAQHIARVLSQNGFNYFVSEQPPPGLSVEDTRAQNYGVYSARYGNIYTVRQLLQLMQRAEGSFVPEEEVWRDRAGRIVDPFRPQIQPEGFADRGELLRSREEHFAAVRHMLRTMDVFIFTLGLTEAWRSLCDGAVFPLAPGVAGGEMDFDRYEFVNFTTTEVIDDMHAVLDRLAVLNPKCRVIMTVSPVPLIATYEPRHALVATTYSKSVLRSVADVIQRLYDHVEYFPSYEIITGAYNRGAYFENDLRNVKEEGVAHVMRVFLEHYTGNQSAAPANRDHAAQAATGQSGSRLSEIICDEHAIAAFYCDTATAGGFRSIRDK
jgi:hypothetical protein